MMTGRWMSLALIVLAAPAIGQHHPQAAISGPTHASAYAEGLYLLHNFEYGRARDAFRRAQAADPANVMAYWGEAMSFNHPLWAYQDKEAGRAALAKLAPTPEARRARARTPREAGWLEAVEALYGEGDKLARDRIYHARMMALHEADPSDVEARSFAALATLGLASQGRDTAIYMRAAAMLEEGFATNREHPGLLHYLIHSYDDPAHAPLGLRAARLYAGIAPDAGHAQHMVSHIYLATGDWEKVQSTNLQAIRVVNAERAAQGRPPTACGHYNEWLAYALDQQGRDSRAVVDACRAEAIAEIAEGADTTRLGAGRSLFNNWAVIAVRHGVDTGRWAIDVPVPPENRNALGRFMLAYGRLLAARNDPAEANAALSDLKASRSAIATAWTSERPDDHESQAWLDRAVAQGEAVATLARGEIEPGLQLLQAAVQAEESLPLPFGPPVLPKPSSELLADEYLLLGRTAEAHELYRRTLANMPGRRRALAALGDSR